MYLFSKKEERARFKKTEYGRKANKWAYITLSIAVLLGILVVVLFFLRENRTITMTTNLKRFVHATFIAFVGIAGYFVGKRDCAIEHLKQPK